MFSVRAKSTYLHLVIVVKDDVVKLQGKVHHQTSDVED